VAFDVLRQRLRALADVAFREYMGTGSVDRRAAGSERCARWTESEAAHFIATALDAVGYETNRLVAS
jgi:hypothetical protein